MLSSSSILTDEKITFELIKEIVISRSITSRKGDNGIVLVVWGNRLYHGAPALSSMVCLRSGTDLVFTAVPFSNVIATRSFSPNLVALPMVDDTLTLKSVNDLLKMLPKVPDSVAVGMGMSVQKEALLHLIRQLLSAKKRIKILLMPLHLFPMYWPKYLERIPLSSRILVNIKELSETISPIFLLSKKLQI